MAVVDQDDTAPADVEVVVALRHDLVDEVGQRAGDLDAGRAGPDDDEGQSSQVEAGGIEVGVLEDLQDPVPEPLGVDRRVEGERVLGRSRYAKEVGLGAHGQHQMVAAEGLALSARHGPGRRVDGHDLTVLDRDRRRLAEHGPQGPSDIGRGQLRGRDLVQQGLELVVVVAVDQGHGDTGIAQDLSAADPREPPADDHDLLPGARHRRRPYLRPHQPAHPSRAIRFTVGRCHDAGAPLNRADPNATRGRRP